MSKDLKLSSLEWKEFKLNDLFERIEKGKCQNTNKETKESINGVSFLSATLNNNGVSGFVEPNYLLQKGNCIMFVNQGDGGAGYSVYKKEDFISTTSNSFGYAKWINKYTGLFVASILCRFKEKYSFGYGRTENRLRKDKVFLPINSKGQPNWEFMENYMRKIEEKQKQKAIKYYSDKIKNLQNSLMKNKFDLNDIEWKEFKISEIFNIFTGATIRQSDLIKGKIPRITATNLNNGIAFFTQETNNYNFKKFKNFISISFLGSVFYQPKEVSLDMKIHGIKIKDRELNTHIALFLIPIIKRFSFKYAYGYQLSTSILKAQKLQLPVNSKGQPNWEFMENFMRKIEYKKLNIYLDYIKNKTATN